MSQKVPPKYLKVDLKNIRALPGHKSSKTIEIYTHVNRAILTDIKNLPNSIFKEQQT